MRDGLPGGDAGRAFWWAVLRTERDRRLALAAGRPITARNLRRLLGRRIAKFEGADRPRDDHGGSNG